MSTKSQGFYFDSLSLPTVQRAVYAELVWGAFNQFDSGMRCEVSVRLGSSAHESKQKFVME